MTEEEEKKLNALLTSEMVSRVTLAESINIIHSMAIGEVKANLEQMSEEEKKSALEELTIKAEEAMKKTEDQLAELEKTEA